MPSSSRPAPVSPWRRHSARITSSSDFLPRVLLRKSEEMPITPSHLEHALARQILARAQKRRRGAVLESPVAFADCSHEEYVTLHRRGLAEEAYVMLA